MRLGSGNRRQEDRRTVELLRRLPPHILQGHFGTKTINQKNRFNPDCDCAEILVGGTPLPALAFTTRYRSFLAETALVTVYPSALKSSASFSALCTAFSNGIRFKCS